MSLLKKILLVFFVILSIITILKIGSILINDFERLTKYGIGYLTGIAILFLSSLIISFALGSNLLKEKS
jgi:uncharacterized YccA/Bax inhibitor family protein